MLLKTQTIPAKGSCYAVTTGDYVGEIFVFFYNKNDVFYFVSIPKMILRVVDSEKFDIGISENILDFVRILPEDVYSAIEQHGKRLVKN